MSQLSMFEPDDAVGAVERWCRTSGVRRIVGVDEAGRGPLAGPVYTAAVALDVEDLSGSWIGELDDSKALEAERRASLFERIRERAPARAITSSDPERIDEINILEATREAMARAVESVEDDWEATPEVVFVDGDVALEIGHRQRAVVGGDGLSYAIAAASILAKVARDRVMIAYNEEWPEYGFASNKGYPTPDHRRALERNGPCPIHRRSFESVPE